MTKMKEKVIKKSRGSRYKKLQIKITFSSLTLQQLIEEGGFFFQIRVKPEREKKTCYVAGLLARVT